MNASLRSPQHPEPRWLGKVVKINEARTLRRLRREAAGHQQQASHLRIPKLGKRELARWKEGLRMLIEPPPPSKHAAVLKRWRNQFQ